MGFSGKEGDVAAIHLRSDGTSLLIDLADDRPAIVHWGEDLGAVRDDVLDGIALASRAQRVSGGLDATARRSLLATPAEGWLATPAVEGHRDGRTASLLFAASGSESDGASATLTYADSESALAATVLIELLPGGLARQRATVRNDGDTVFTVQSALLAFPVPWAATEVLDTTGHHLRERAPQRHPFSIGQLVRESRRGRPGADATVLLAAGRPGFGFESGLVHGIHVAWSGNHRVVAERTVTGEAALLGGELLMPGEGRLLPGEEYTTPWVYGSWGDGLDALAHRFHTAWRARPEHPTRPRPITLNTWEAVYFDHDLATLTTLADLAADVGVERFVLDDGWFTGRRDDTAGLGDWFVDAEVWPDGLHPLVDHVRARGMEFGLWVEPEMVNPDSDLARAHPDWILRGRRDLPPSARQQQVLNLARPDAYAYIAKRLHALLDEYPIAYLKWDHNRDLVDAGDGAGGGARVHANVVALYRLLAELKAAHPALEIESCASGGARVDLGILSLTDRIWTSDCLDPLERLTNQRYTGLVVPPEMMGMHLTSPVVHSTHRTVDLGFAAATTLFGHMGIEWDLTTANAAARDRVRDAVAYAVSIRELVRTGRTVNVDGVDAGLDVRGMVAADGARAVYTIAQTATAAALPPGAVRFPGLDPERVYRFDVRGGAPSQPGQSPLPWADSGVVLTGRAAATAGLRPPVQYPERAVIVTADAID